MTESNSTVVKQPSFRIRNLTVSVEVSDKEYGNGDSGYTSISGHVDDANLDQIDDVIDAGLSLFLAGWQTVIAGKVATKMLSMTGQEFKDTVAAIQKRVTKVRGLLREGNTEKKEDKA